MTHFLSNILFLKILYAFIQYTSKILQLPHLNFPTRIFFILHHPYHLILVYSSYCNLLIFSNISFLCSWQFYHYVQCRSFHKTVIIFSSGLFYSSPVIYFIGKSFRGTMSPKCKKNCSSNKREELYRTIPTGIIDTLLPKLWIRRDQIYSYCFVWRYDYKQQFWSACQTCGKVDVCYWAAGLRNRFLLSRFPDE